MAGMPIRRMRRNGMFDFFRSQASKDRDTFDRLAERIEANINEDLPRLSRKHGLSRSKTYFVEGRFNVSGYLRRMREKMAAIHGDGSLRASAEVYRQARMIENLLARETDGEYDPGFDATVWDRKAKEVLGV